MDDERYFTVNDLLLLVLAATVFSFIFGFVVGVYARKSVEPEYSIVETTSNFSTTEEIKTATPETETTTSESTTTTETTMTESETTSTTKATTVTTSKSVKTGEDESSLTPLGTFKGTYYAGKTVPCKGGSGRALIDCTVGSDGMKGSVASRYAYEKWGYKKDGRTKLYLVVTGRPSMTGWYYVDDRNAVNSIIDFYYYRNSNCPFQKAGVVEVKAYVRIS